MAGVVVLRASSPASSLTEESDAATASSDNSEKHLSLRVISSNKDWTRSFEKKKKSAYGKYLIFNKSITPFSNVEHDLCIPTAMSTITYPHLEPHKRQGICIEGMECLQFCMEWGRNEYVITEKYRGAKLMGSACPQLSTDDEDSCEETGKGLKLEKQMRLDAEINKLNNLMHTKIKQYQKRSRITIKQLISLSPSSSNFLQSALLSIKPVHPEDPFTMLGIELRCVDCLEEIYDIEGLSKENFSLKEDIIVDALAIEAADFLKSLLEYKADNINHGLMCRLTMNLFALSKEDPERWNAIDAKWGKTKVRNLLRRLVMLVDEYIQTDAKVIKTTEAQLYQFLCDFINLDDDETFCNNAPTEKSLTQFRWVLGEHCVSQTSTADLEYIFIGKNLKTLRKKPEEMETRDLSKNNEEKKTTRAPDRPAENETREVDTSLVPPVVPILINEIKKEKGLIVDIDNEKMAIQPQLMFQCYKEALGSAVVANHQKHKEGKSKILQTCTFTIGDKVRSCVLCIDMEQYISFMKFNDAETTIHWIRNNAAYGGNFQNWCRFYVDVNESEIFDICKELKYVCKNFCICL